MKLAVIGAGAAGCAAAAHAARLGLDVEVFSDRAGASALFSGAVDRHPWDDPPREPEDAALAPELRSLIDELGVFNLPARPVRIATGSGIIRTARGGDRALLDLAPLAGKTVAVADVERDEWDAGLLAASLGASEWAQKTRTSFRAVRVALLEHSHERRIAPADFAALHDQAERADALADRLGSADPRAQGWLTGPWLGLVPGTPARIGKRLGRPLGEVTSLPGGPAGARFDAARRGLLEASDVVRHEARVTAVLPAENGWIVCSETEGAGRELPVDAVILACGGVAAGGIRWADPALGERGFVFAISGPFCVVLDGRDAESPGAVHGTDLSAAGLGALERVGLACDGVNVLGAPGVYAAGDVRASRPRSVLEALESGIAAARAAADGASLTRRPLAEQSAMR